MLDTLPNDVLDQVLVLATTADPVCAWYAVDHACLRAYNRLAAGDKLDKIRLEALLRETKWWNTLFMIMLHGPKPGPRLGQTISDTSLDSPESWTQLCFELAALDRIGVFKWLLDNVCMGKYEYCMEAGISRMVCDGDGLKQAANLYQRHRLLQDRIMKLAEYWVSAGLPSVQSPLQKFMMADEIAVIQQQHARDIAASSEWLRTALWLAVVGRPKPESTLMFAEALLKYPIPCLVIPLMAKMPVCSTSKAIVPPAITHIETCDTCQQKLARDYPSISTMCRLTDNMDMSVRLISATIAFVQPEYVALLLKLLLKSHKFHSSNELAETACVLAIEAGHSVDWDAVNPPAPPAPEIRLPHRLPEFVPAKPAQNADKWQAEIQANFTQPRPPVRPLDNDLDNDLDDYLDNDLDNDDLDNEDDNDDTEDPEDMPDNE